MTHRLRYLGAVAVSLAVPAHAHAAGLVPSVAVPDPAVSTVLPSTAQAAIATAVRTASAPAGVPVRSSSGGVSVPMAQALIAAHRAPASPRIPASPRRSTTTPDPPAAAGAAPPVGAINIVVIIRVNSPGNDGAVVQANGLPVALRLSTSSVGRLAGGPTSTAAVNRVLSSPQVSTRYAKWLRSWCGAGAPSTATRASLVASLLRCARGRLIAHHRVVPRRVGLVPVRSRAPARPIAVAALSAPPGPRFRSVARTRPRRTVPVSHRTRPKPARSAVIPALVVAPLDRMLAVPGASANAGAGASASGGLVLALVAIVSLAIVCTAIGRRLRLHSAMRDALRSSRLERPG